MQANTIWGLASVEANPGVISVMICERLLSFQGIMGMIEWKQGLK